jgi:hypothetical protein
VTLTATVVDTSSNPVIQGQVLFCNSSATYCEDASILGSAQLTSSGSASIKLRPGLGANSIQARFLGTIVYSASSSSTSIVSVSELAPSTVSIVSTGSVGLYTLAATVGGVGSTGPTGTVTFEDSSNGGATLANASLVTGTQATSFQPQVSYTTGSQPRSVVVGDLNGDGVPDLVTANGSSTGNTISVLLGNGDGTFQTQQTYTTGTAPYDVVVGDLNGDGKLDLVTANIVSSTLSIFLGNGDGTFQAAQTYSLGSNLAYVAIGDFNHDGIPDLVAEFDNGANFAGTVSILLGNGDGTFGPQSAYSVGSGADGIVVADFNGDGILDIATANYGESSLSILLGNGDGTFKTQVRAYPNEANPVTLVSGDFNRDGKPDLAIGNLDPNVNEYFRRHNARQWR